MIRRVRVWLPSAVSAALLMAGLSACGDDARDAQDLVVTTRAQLRARIADFSRPPRPADRPPLELIRAAEDLCGAGALDGPPSRLVAHRVGRRQLDVWLVPMADGRVALVYGGRARTCGRVPGVVGEALHDGVPIRKP